MRLGFVGTGTISSAVIAGLMQSDLKIEQITVSPRNSETAAKLAERYSRVSIGRDNQDVVDTSQVVFLAVRSQVAEAIIKEIRFRPEQHIVSFIPVFSIETISEWIGVPAKLTRAVPLPFVAQGMGATAFYPSDETISAVFAELGTAVAVTDLQEYEVLTTSGALMGTYFGILENAELWLTGNGVPSAQAHAYLRQLFAGLAHATSSSPHSSFSELRTEFSTKGGLNEQLFADFQKAGGTTALTNALTVALERMQGRVKREQ
ncbi:NAD(P)-binding domain-containing protein [Mesorhizobium loti]|nr:NAD(P)-binding domain-containing protein [Mesorhizobium loti]